MKTISELNSKWWYRFIKVIYYLFLFFFIVCYPVGIFFSFEPKYDYDKSYVKCANGKTFILSENKIKLNDDYTPFYTEGIKYLCFDGEFRMVESGIPGSGFLSKVLTREVISETANSGKYELVSQWTKRDWSAIVGLSLLTILGTLIFFELIRRIFYYIILGSLKPKK